MTRVCQRVRHFDHPHSVTPAMPLIVTIFSLVFLTELVSWIGKSVLLEFVCRPFRMSRRST